MGSAGFFPTGLAGLGPNMAISEEWEDVSVPWSKFQTRLNEKPHASSRNFGIKLYNTYLPHMDYIK